MCFTQPAGFHQLRAAGVSARYLGFERHLHHLLKIFFEIVAISAIFEYTISEPMACRSSRLEYDERVCLASASDGVLQSVEYRIRVGRACRKVGSSFFFIGKTACGALLN